MCIVQDAQTKSLFSCQPMKRPFHKSKKCKACCHMLSESFKNQKMTTMMFGVDGTNRFARKTCQDYEKEKPSAFSAIHNQAHPNLTQKKAEIFPFIA